MPSPLERLTSSLNSASWLDRTRENARLLFTLHPGAPSSANGAPIHLLDTRNARPSGRAQTASLLLHAAVGAGIFLALAYVPSGPTPHVGKPIAVDDFRRLPAYYPRSNPSLGERGGSPGNNNPLPPTRGDFTFSQIQLLRPRLPDQQQHPLMAQPSIQDDQAPNITPVPAELGLPWMKDRTNSGGPGPGDSIGTGKNGQIGDDDGTGYSKDKGSYNPGVTPVHCAYCPDPLYTDEARKAKLQGRVLLRVLVGVDGRAADIRVITPLGLGLDERAVETVRSWRFVPSKDAANKPVPSWVTVETVYRLF